jgi:hypothetical protein
VSKITTKDLQRSYRKISRAANRIKTIKFIIGLIITVTMLLGLIAAIKYGLAGMIRGILS